MLNQTLTGFGVTGYGHSGGGEKFQTITYQKRGKSSTIDPSSIGGVPQGDYFRTGPAAT